MGVIVGGLLTWVHEWWKDRRQGKRNARYLAVRVVCALDKFIDLCAETVGQEDQETDLPVSSWPETLDFPADVDWRSLTEDLLYEVLSLPNEVATAHKAVDYAGRVSHGELDAVTRYYTPVGLKAVNLAQDLRRAYHIPERAFGKWNPVTHLEEQNAKISR